MIPFLRVVIAMSEEFLRTLPATAIARLAHGEPCNYCGVHTLNKGYDNHPACCGRPRCIEKSFDQP